MRRELAALARRVVEVLGGRFSTELGIDVDAGRSELARWFLAATLFGTRISAGVAGRTFHVLDAAGVSVAGARHVDWDTLVELLDAGGYARYDFRTATRLQALSEVLEARYGGDVTAIASAVSTTPALQAALDALPGWGPVTVGVFLRELRGVWALADPPLAEPVLWAGRHLGLFAPRTSDHRLPALARAAGVDRRDLECGLVRLRLAHHRQVATSCPGGARCRVLDLRAAKANETPARARRPA